MKVYNLYSNFKISVMNKIIATSAICSFTSLIVNASDKKPNIILILADDLGIGDLSAYNPYSKISTPVIDGLCNDGVRFTDAHATSSLSTPSRYSILAGRY